MRKFLVLLVLSALIGCTDDTRTRSTLTAAGFTNIQTKGYSWTGCSEEDTYATKFRAKNPKGRWVSGVVCCGVLKGCTIRF